MRLYLFVALRIIFISLALTETDITQICHISGEYYSFETNYVFSLSDLPERCDTFIYGCYIYDATDMDDVTKLYENDQAAIKMLKEAEKTVFTYFSYEYAGNWDQWFKSMGDAIYDKMLCQFVKTVTDFSIDGIIVSISDLYDGTVTAADVENFITNIKREIPNLIIGITVDASNAVDKITDNTLFDFCQLNPLIDLYYIRTATRLNHCTSDVLESGTIITSTDPDAVTLEKISQAVANSSMDKNKTIAKIQIEVLLDDKGERGTNTQLCVETNTEVACMWCADKSQKFYDEAKFVKDYFHGISIAWLDYDDFDCSCGCHKYPITNIILDGWNGVPLTACEKIDEL